MALVDILSVDRFSTYVLWADGDHALAERLYSYNVQLSSDFYSSLHMLEIALRNRADVALTAACGANWLDDPAVLVDGYQQRCVTEARASLLRENKAATHGQMIAELNLGFWSSLFGRSSSHLWGHLRPIFQVKGLQRSHIADKLRNLRRLRNRVAHYEPILALPIASLHTDVLDLTSWMSADAVAWIQTHSNITYPGTPILVPDKAGIDRFDRNLITLLPV